MDTNKTHSEKISQSADNQNLSPDGMYYIENGFYVFTEKFHLKRGYCCSNGCRHCPYTSRVIEKDI
ncbi:MAG TPA: DUF5522 domain-containing protein [Leptospiraceae bacterium]|nr:DUF5522 domain-containing protein [Leptospiraceae bacterium]HRG73822.1 DUF5522 domain-containing protein [Leptospiraceae bacterium]